MSASEDELRIAREREIASLKELEAQQPTNDPDGVTGVLLDDQIRRYATEYKMIFPFNEDDLKPASYKLHVGTEYYYKTRFETLKEGEEIEIVPFQVVVIRTHETINLPKFIIGRWNIRVSLAYKGLLWVGGPQVDPGWVGRLSCPIYNLSNKTVRLRLGDYFAVIDFEKTSKYDAKKNKAYPFPPGRVMLKEYGIDDFKSEMYEKSKIEIDNTLDEIREKMKDVETTVDRSSRRLDFFVTLIITSIAVLVSVITLTNSSPLDISQSWFYELIVVSSAAFGISLFTFLHGLWLSCKVKRMKKTDGKSN